MRTKSIKVLIVDDEPLARKYIRKMLRNERDIEVIGEAGNGKTAGRMIARNRPDLMFLDIQMPEMDGFTLLQNLHQQDLPAIVFTTAYEEYAIRAFEVHAIDYLLKPFDELRFAQALEHARSMFTKPSDSEQSTAIAELLKAIQKKEKFIERLLVRQNGRIVFLNVSDIDWIKADDKYIHIHCGKSSHIIRRTLSSIKAELDPAKFIQVNRSVIVNVGSIKELHPMFNGDHDVQIHDGTKFSLSRNHKNELFDLLGRPVS